MGPETRVLPVLNGIRHLDALDAAFGKARVLGGTAQIGATLAPDGTIRHMSKFHLLTFGERVPAQANFCGHLARMMEKATFDARHSPHIMQDMWDKFVMITVVAGMTTLMRGSIGDIVEARDGAGLIGVAGMADREGLDVFLLDAARHRAQGRHRGRSHRRRHARPRRGGEASGADAAHDLRRAPNLPGPPQARRVVKQVK
jgi:ketopantoate reductase